MVAHKTAEFALAEIEFINYDMEWLKSQSRPLFTMLFEN